MNYTTFILNDKKVGLKFGMASFRYLQDKFSKGLAFANDDLNEIGISHIIYSGYYNNCLVKDVHPEISFEEIVEYVESNLLNDEFMNSIKELIEFWSNNDFIKQNQPQQETKKKMIRGKK